MKKDDIIAQIRAARLAHVQWVQRAKSLVNGLEIHEEDIPLMPDSCIFGKWFYSDGQVLLAIFNEKTVREVEHLHNDLHDEYMKIFKIYFSTSNLSFLEKILKSKKKVSNIDKSQALKHLKNLEKISDQLIKNLNIIETKINMADAKTLEKYV